MIEVVTVFEWATIKVIGTVLTYGALLLGLLTFWAVRQRPRTLPARTLALVVALLTSIMLFLALADVAFTLDVIPLSLWSALRRLVGRVVLFGVHAVLAYAVLREEAPVC